ncbi:dynamin family protein [Acetobacterium sp.]|uniref:dynamin family protein n=1 Tax=Acetobacterium sp. TaxID=1872094 RepID=UPI00359382B5
MEKSKILEANIKKIKNTKPVNSNMIYSSEMQILLDRLGDSDFKVAVVGEFSSGKSTFINAMLKKDILKHESRETTACITYLVNVPKNSDKDGKCEVTFKDGQTISLDSLEDLREVTTTSSNKHNVSSEISCVRIMQHFFDENENFTLIDTPGLNGIADNHRQLTIDEVKNAHACIYLLQLRSLTKSDVEFIKYLAQYQDKFIFVQNFIDELKSQEGETVELKIQEIEKILKERVFNELDGDYEYKVCGVSAIKALTAYDNSIKRLYAYDEIDLSETDRKQLLEESLFEEYAIILKNDFGKEKYEEVKTKAVQSTFENLLQKILIKAEDILETNQELYNQSKDKTQIEHLANKRNILAEKRTSNKGIIDNFILSEQGKIKRLLVDDITLQIKGLNEEMAEVIGSQSDYSGFKERVTNQSFNRMIQTRLYSVDQKVENNKNNCLQQLFNNVLLRIDELCTWNQMDNKNSKLDFEKIAFEQNDSMEKEKSYLENLRNQLKKEKERIIKNEVDSEKARAELKEQREQIERTKREISEVEKKQASMINRLGQKPAKERKTRPVKEERYRDGILGGIANFFCGTKTVTVEKEYFDDSRCKKWEKDLRDIKEKSGENRDRLNRQISMLESNVISKEENLKHTQMDKQKADQAYQNAKKQLEEKEKELKFFEEKAMKEFFEVKKNEYIKLISNYLIDDENSVLQTRIESLRGNLEKNIEMIKINARKRYDETYDANLKTIDSLINGKQQLLTGELKEFEVSIQLYREILNNGGAAYAKC